MTMVDFFSALPGILGPLAWPAVAVVVAILFRPQIANLLTRLRKGGGAEFDPIRQPTKHPDGLPEARAPVTDDASESPFPRTETTREIEDLILSLPQVAEAHDRDTVLVTLAARAVLITYFEQVESSIWKSQIELLIYLNSCPNGADPDHVRQMFYQPASTRYPDVFATYPYEPYLDYLVNHKLVEVAGSVTRITERGREYLVWRIGARKAPKMYG